MKATSIFEVYADEKGRPYTVNAAPGIQVYDEKLVTLKGVEYREWNPRKSKLAASIMKGSPNIFMRKGDVILYLGCSTGTTVSHVSDIVGDEGFIFALDFAPRVMREMVFTAEKRKNIAPLLADANKPEAYAGKVTMADVIYQDIAQRNQVEILAKNCGLFLKRDGIAMIAIKARSIDVAEKPAKIFADVKRQLEENFRIIDYRNLEPMQKDHAFFVCRKR